MSGASLYLMALLDGKPGVYMQITLTTGGSYPDHQSRECVFVFRNVPRGAHTLEIRWRSSNGAWVYLGDRTMAATTVACQWPLLVTGMESTRPTGYKYGGQFSSTVVEVRNGKRYFKPYVAENFFRHPHAVNGWFQEVSKGAMHLAEAAVIGPHLKKYDEKYYRENIPSPFTEMKKEALVKADPYFDYSYYDRSGDGVVTTDELFPVVILYQDYNFGEVRYNVTGVSTSDGVTLDFKGGLATVYTPDFNGSGPLGVITHELCHLLIGARDMYPEQSKPRLPGMPGPYSIMDYHAYFAHLDPAQRIKVAGWESPAVVAQDGYQLLRGVSEGGSIYKLRDPAHHAGEYFLVECRRKFGMFESRLPSEGIAVWHIDERRLPEWRFAAELEPAGGATNHFKYETYLFKGTQPGFHADNDVHDDSNHTNTRWHDTSRSGIGVWAIWKRNDGLWRAYFDVPGPGILVQFENMDQNIDPDGWATLRLRLVNTDYTPNTFRLSASLAGYVSRLPSTVALGAYQQRIIVFRVKPIPSNFKAPVSVTAVSTLNSVKCTDTVTLRYSLEASGSMIPNSTVTLQCYYPSQAGMQYVMGASLGMAPGIPLPGVGTLPLNPDTLFYSCWFLPGIFRNFTGQLDTYGKARSYVAIPGLSQLKGTKVYCAYVTYDPRGIRAISNAVVIEIR